MKTLLKLKDMENKVQQLQSIIYRHTGLLRETIAQRELFGSENEYLHAWVKRATCINLAQKMLLKLI